ncbi:MAG: hypothetical protein P4L45_01370 [Ignavibacteriaceae bacterium]|nr:hypothetical protein [Ignavibacteriaceae bacterium]
MKERYPPSYGRDNEGLFEQFESFTEHFSKSESDNIGLYKKTIIELFNTTYSLMSLLIPWCFLDPYAHRHSMTKLLFSTLHKNYFAFYSSYKQTLFGLYGPSRIFLRYIYEGLVISKYCSISEDNRIYQRWEDGEVIYFSNSILKKISEPTKSALEEMWNILCNFSHANKYSLQVSLSTDEVFKEIGLNLPLLIALLECNYHLLNSHFITKSMLNSYKSAFEWEPLKALKQKQRITIRNAMITKKTRTFVREFNKTWVIKT